MKTKQSKAIAICLVVALYFAMFLSFILGEMKERADDTKLINSGIHVDYYMKSTYWDLIGIGFFIVATITAIGAFRYFRHQKSDNVNSLSLTD